MQRFMMLKKFADPRPLAKIVEGRAASHPHMLAVIYQLAGDTIVVRSGPSAQFSPRFEQLNMKTFLAQRSGGGESRQAASPRSPRFLALDFGRTLPTPLMTALDSNSRRRSSICGESSIERGDSTRPADHIES